MKTVHDGPGQAAAMSGVSSSSSGSKTIDYRDKRSDERFELQHAPGVLIHKGAKIACEMLDVSLGGCCMRTRTPFRAGALEWVRVVFSIHGMVLTMDGVTQWTRWQRVMGIRFMHPSVRTRNQLAGLLTCLMDESACEVVKREIAAGSGRAGKAIIALAQPLHVEQPQAENVEPYPLQAGPVQHVHDAPHTARPSLSSEHKVLSLEAGESPSLLYQVGRDAPLDGHVLDVSQEACLLRLKAAATLRPEAGVEVDFSLRGVHFRLPGTTREMHDGRVVEIEFHAMSVRKRDSLAEVITELMEARGGAKHGV